MKFNLKNRPHIKAKRKGDQYSTEEWFDGFEKELREMIPHEASEWYKPYKQLIKEILGE